MQSLSNMDVKMDQGHRNHSVLYGLVCRYLPHSTLVRVLWQVWQSNIHVIEGTLSFIDCIAQTPKKSTCRLLTDIKRDIFFIMTPFQWIVPFWQNFPQEGYHLLACTGSSRKNLAKFCDIGSFRADGLCIGSLRLVCGRKGEIQLYKNFFCTTL